jgi:hypothetical protein
MATSANNGSTSKIGIGDARGFYTILGESAVTAPELARVMRADIGDVRDWLVGQVEQGYVIHDPITHRFATWTALPARARVQQIAA